MFANAANPPLPDNCEIVLPMNALVKAQDFFDQMREDNGAFRLLRSNIPGETAMLRGRFQKTAIRDGLTLHYSDVTNLCDLQTDAEAPPHLGIKLFFEGGVSANIGRQDIPMPRLDGTTGRWIPSATLLQQQEPERFERRAAIGDRIRKLSIKIMPEWLEGGDVFRDGGAQNLKRFTASVLCARSWKPSMHLLALAEQVINPPDLEPYLKRLHIESRVISIIAEAFGLLDVSVQRQRSTAKLSGTESRRLRKIEDLLKHSINMPSVEEIARDVGVSVNTLQRLFQVAHGTSVFNYVRSLKLEQARIALEKEGLSIAQVAYLAGYSSAANFSTAFKKHYGISPSEVRK